MISCEVVNANNTGRPCPNPGTETAELVYTSGVSETKRCCPEHAAMVEKASDAVRAILAARAEARRAESDARAERIAAHRLERPPADPVPPVTPTEETTTMPEPTQAQAPADSGRGSPARKPGPKFSGVKRCRWCGKGTYPLCRPDRSRVLALRRWTEEPGCVPEGFDPATSPIEPLREAWERRSLWLRSNRRKPVPTKVVEPDGGGEAPDLTPRPARWEALEDAERHRAEAAETEVALLRAALEGQTLANAPLRERIARQDSEINTFHATQAEFRSKVHAAIGARGPIATDDPLLTRIVTVAVDYTVATATVQQVVDALAGKERPDGYTSSIAKSVAELRVEEYANGRIAGDVARFGRCRQDLARALGMNAPDDLALVERWDELLGRVSTLERERDEAVQSIAALRADADELRALREALVSGKGRGIGRDSLDALNVAEGRMLEAVRERTRSHDDQTVAVLKYATERILDSIATAAKDGRPADLGLLEAVRAIATGRVQ